MNNTFFIDIRKSDEVYSIKFSNKVNHICIPSNMIRFNLPLLRSLVRLNEKVYLICSSGTRSQFIYDKYFSNDNILNKVTVDNIIQFNNFEVMENGLLHGKYNLEIKNRLGFLPEFIYKGYNYYSLTRVLQTILGTLLIFIAVVLWKKCNEDKKWILWIALIMGVNALINGLTSTCTISKVFMNSLN